MKNLILFLFGFVLSISVTAQTKSIQKSAPLSEATPESVGISSERLARIDQMCKAEVDAGNLPGIVVLVARNGKIVFLNSYGMANTDTGTKMKNDAIFRIASQTKAITSTAVMMLWEEGKFQLDDPISKYIPEFKEQKVLTGFNYSDTTWTGVPVKNEITIRNLLSHTSGIGYGMIDNDERFKMIYQKAGIIDAFTTEPVKVAENIKKLAKMPLHHNPGENFTYSEGLDVLGYLIEIVSGEPFDQYMKNHILDPLGMNDTYFYLPDSKADRLVAVEYLDNGDWKKAPATPLFDPDYPIKGAKSYFAGGAGLSSTAKDYATFLQMYLNGGEYNGVRLLSRKTVDVILSNQIGNIWGENSDNKFGLAFQLVTEEGQNKGGSGSEGTFSWGGYFNTQYFADPEENVIGIIMKQTSGPVNDVTGWKFQQLVFQTIDD